MNSESLELLRELVNANSSTDNPAGLEVVRKILITAFEKEGFKVAVKETGQGRKVLSFEAPNSTPKLAWIGHIDTVFSLSSSFQRLSETSEHLIGPGVIDMKGGIVLMLDILRALRLSQISRDREIRKQIRVIINDDEEIGSPHSRDVLLALTRGITDALVFEPGLPDGAVVTSHSGAKWFRLTVKGKSAHAGLEPENGVDAGVELSSKVVKIAEMNDFANGLSVNPGVLKGGSKPNIVCDEAHAIVDVRYPTEATLTQVDARMEKIRADSYVFNSKLKLSPSAKLETVAHLPLMPPKATKRIFSLLTVVAKDLKQEIEGRHVGYVSDGNHLASTGINLLVGLGPYGGGMHTCSEFMLKSSYPERLALNLGLTRILLGS